MYVGLGRGVWEVEVWMCGRLGTGFCAEILWGFGGLESEGDCGLSGRCSDGVGKLKLYSNWCGWAESGNVLPCVMGL